MLQKNHFDENSSTYEIKKQHHDHLICTDCGKIIEFMDNDLEKLQELQIKIDCDVINADGGTRTASITGGWVVLKMLVESLIKNKTLKNNPIKDQVAAISCGIFKGEEILDLDYFEDSNTEIDANFVVSKSKNLIEVQATAEKGGFTKTQLNTLIDMACKECDNLFSIQSEVIKNEK